MVLEKILLAIYGFVLLFFWGSSYGLAKDRARRGYSISGATLFSLTFILGFTVLVCVLFVLLIWVAGGAHGTFTHGLAKIVSLVLDALVNDWKLGVGLFGMLMSALLGAGLGIKQYHEEDRYYVEPD